MPAIAVDPKALVQLKRISKYFRELGDRLADIAAEGAAKYFLNVLIRTEVPPYKYVSRKQAYGVTFFTAKQRRWFFASLRGDKSVLGGEMQLPYKRRSPKGGLTASWKMKGSGRNLTLINDEPHASFVYGPGQSRHMTKIGWPQLAALVEKYRTRATDAAIRAIKSYIRAQK